MEKLIWLKFQNAYKWSPRIKCNMYACLLCSLSSKQVSSATMTIVFPSAHFSCLPSLSSAFLSFTHCRFLFLLPPPPFSRCLLLSTISVPITPPSTRCISLCRRIHSASRSICCCLPPSRQVPAHKLFGCGIII